MTVLPSLAPRSLARGVAALAVVAGLALSPVTHSSSSGASGSAAASAPQGGAVVLGDTPVELTAHTTSVSRVTTPPCPSAEALFRRLSGTATAGAKATLLSRQVACSGDWAVIGVGLQRPGATAGNVVPTAQLFRHVSGTWRWRDAGNACRAGLVPAALVPSVCDAG